MKRFLWVVLGLSGYCLLDGCGGGASGPPPAPGALSIAPASLSFGVMVVGNESGAQPGTLTNTGGSELAISNMAISGTNATDFGRSGTCASSLGAGMSCTVNVTFTPTALGQRSAAITITNDGVGSPQVLSLNGLGAEPGPNATLSPTSLSFGNEDVGTTSPAQSVKVSNYGAMTLDIAAIIASTDFGETNTCAATLASGDSCTVNVTFTPGSSGDLNGTLSLTDSAADSPQTVALSGTGVSLTCIPIGDACFGPSHPHCCAAPFPHHSFCTNQTGWGKCVMD